MPPALPPVDQKRRNGRRTPNGPTASIAIVFALLLFGGIAPLTLGTGTSKPTQHLVTLPVPPRVSSPGPTIPSAPTTVAVPPITTPPPPMTTLPPPTTTPPPPVPAIATVPQVAAQSGLPARGHATGYGCGPALAYLYLYAAPTFNFVCPGYAQGFEAVTCINVGPCRPGQHLIIIADPCPAAYMNEASNSWTLQYGGRIDPYGSCPV